LRVDIGKLLGGLVRRARGLGVLDLLLEQISKDRVLLQKLSFQRGSSMA
jgi:hypothetical protein